jgi:hypothetical protein
MDAHNDQPAGGRVMNHTSRRLIVATLQPDETYVGHRLLPGYTSPELQGKAIVCCEHTALKIDHQPAWALGAYVVHIMEDDFDERPEANEPPRLWIRGLGVTAVPLPKFTLNAEPWGHTPDER